MTGLHDISAAEYHRDPCPEPSLSASIAERLLTRSPLHAWYAHPRLNPRFRREEREIFDLGTVAHAYLLEGVEAFAIIDAEDWRTKAAKEARDAAREAGKTPILQKKWADVVAMAEAVNRKLDSFSDGPRPFAAGKAERTLIWQEGSIWCRARPDFLHDSFAFVDDLKSTGASANPEEWTRNALYSGPDIQAALYRRGVKAITGIEPIFRFVVAENFPPFACSVVSLGPDAWVIADKKVRMAIEKWTRCMERDEWPAYPDRTCYADLPQWVESAWIAREERDLEEGGAPL